MLFTMLGLRSLTKHLRRKDTIINIKLELDDSEKIQNVFKKLLEENAQIKSLRIVEAGEKVCILLEVKLSEKIDIEDLIYDLCIFGAVKELNAV